MIQYNGYRIEFVTLSSLDIPTISALYTELNKYFPYNGHDYSVAAMGKYNYSCFLYCVRTSDKFSFCDRAGNEILGVQSSSTLDRLQSFDCFFMPL